MINTKHVEEIESFEDNKFKRINEHMIALYKTKDTVIVSFKKAKYLAKEYIEETIYNEIIEDVLDNIIFLYNEKKKEIIYPDIFDKYGLCKDMISKIYDLSEINDDTMNYLNTKYMYIVHKLETEINISFDKKYKVFENMVKHSPKGNKSLIRFVKDLWTRKNPDALQRKDYVFNLDVSELPLKEKYGVCLFSFDLNTPFGKIELYNEDGVYCDKSEDKYHNDYILLNSIYVFAINPQILNYSFDDINLIYFAYIANQKTF